MSSFFEKLKKGMGIESIEREERKAEVEKKEIEKKEIEIKEEPVKLETKKIKEGKKVKTPEKWLEPEGQLAVDVYQTEKELVIQSAIAGINPEDLEISLEKDVLTIKGERKKPFEESGDYFFQECYWGPFSRQIILPVEIDPDRIEATLKEGILTIRMPKILREKKRKIAVRG